MRMNNSALQKAILTVGSQSELARRLSISPQRVQFWTKNRIPAEWVLAVEKETGVSRNELRPDIFGQTDTQDGA